METKFHLSIPIKNLEETKEFFVKVLDCTIGRESSDWLDINFFGHQITAVVKPSMVVPSNFYRGKRTSIPVRHFGAVLSWEDWHELKDNLEANKIKFAIEPQLMFKGQVGEQMSLFVKDPNGYAIEFKAFEADGDLFKRS